MGEQERTLKKKIYKAREAHVKAVGRMHTTEAKVQSRLARLQSLEERLTKVRMQLQEVNAQLVHIKQGVTEHIALERVRIQALAREARAIAKAAEEAARTAQERARVAEERMNHYSIGRHLERELALLLEEAELAQIIAQEKAQLAQEAEQMDGSSMQYTQFSVESANGEDALIEHITSLIQAEADAEEEAELVVLEVMEGEQYASGDHQHYYS